MKMMWSHHSKTSNNTQLGRVIKTLEDSTLRLYTKKKLCKNTLKIITNKRVLQEIEELNTSINNKNRIRKKKIKDIKMP